MKTKLIFVLAALGLFLGLYSAFVYSKQPPTQPPAFAPAANPYDKAFYANGIVESSQALGSNINMYPEVSGPITEVFVAEGDTVHRGDALVSLDDSVQRAVADQQRSAAAAALALLEELKAQPRPEALEVARAQVVVSATANLKNLQDHFQKLQAAYQNAQSITLDDLENARGMGSA